ncbi:preprotein translocase subunit SecF [Halobacteriales archaeon QS_1_68_20]|nr:MAG: preprotein translocase subunit SecF [Halobacteriales archaeon QS_1_68_20]
MGGDDVEPFELPFGLGEVDYTKYTNRQLAAVPLGVLAVALAILLVWSTMMAPVGWPAQPGIDFVGGTELQIQTSDSQEEIEAAFSQEPESVRGIAAQEDTYIVTFKEGDTSTLKDDAEAAGYSVEQVREVSATFGGSSQSQALIGVGIAFLGMSIVVFLLFRSFVPSIAVVASAFSDIVIPIALMNLLSIEMSLGTVAALLMIIGYSVDSDLLLNSNILRRRGGFYQSAYRAMNTGITMTLTSLSAMTVMTVVAWFFQIPLLPNIGAVLVFGLAADLMNTYLMNMSLLRWYKFEGVKR